MLRLEAFSYRHAGARQPSLREVDLTVADGEVIGVVGPNDAGKSTLALALAGLVPRVMGGESRGRLVVDEHDVSDLAMHDLPALVGIVFDNPATQLSGVTRTVFEEVAFGPANMGVPLDDLIERTRVALDALAIGDLAERDPARLSGGQQQLVAIASILAMRPRHVVLDEPTAQLDPAGTSLVGEALERLASQGVSIVLIEHKTDVVARVAGRVVVLDAGRVAFEGPSATALADLRLVELGVAAPSHVRLRRRLAAAGLDPAIVGLPA
jgi:energy-coupling factor transporter ATP-binding protein EcfA2